MRLRISHFTPQMEVYLCASVGRCAGCMLLISRFIVWEVPVSSSLQSEKSCNLLWILKLDSLGVRHHFIFQSSDLLFWGTVIKPQEAADPRNAHCGHLFPICVGISLFSKIALKWSKQHVLFAKFQLKVEGWTIKIFCSPITHRDPVILGLPPLQGPLFVYHTQPVGCSWLPAPPFSHSYQTHWKTLGAWPSSFIDSELYLLSTLGSCSVLPTALPGYCHCLLPRSCHNHFSTQHETVLWAFSPNSVPPIKISNDFLIHIKEKWNY